MLVSPTGTMSEFGEGCFVATMVGAVDLFFPHRAQMPPELDIPLFLSSYYPFSSYPSFPNTTLSSFLPGFSLQH